MALHEPEHDRLLPAVEEDEGLALLLGDKLLPELVAEEMIVHC